MHEDEEDKKSKHDKGRFDSHFDFCAATWQLADLLQSCKILLLRLEMKYL